MTQQLNSVGQPETPLYIPFMEFADKEHCMTFARNNQLRLFKKSIQAYDRTVLPTTINCINDEQSLNKSFRSDSLFSLSLESSLISFKL